MALDTTIGGTDSDSYGTLAEADAYHAAYGNVDWALLDGAEKEVVMRRAVAYIDTGYSFKGIKTESTQALEWPRSGVVVDGSYIDSDVIPVAVKRAQFELALKAVSENLIEDQEAGSITEETVDVITVKYSEYSNSGTKRFTVADRLLNKYVLSGGNFHRNVRT